MFHDAMEVPVAPQAVLRDEAGNVVAHADLLVIGTRRVHEYDGAHHRAKSQQRIDLRRNRGLAQWGFDRRGFALDDLLNHAAVVMHELDRELGRAHSRSRLERWRTWVGRIRCTAKRGASASRTAGSGGWGSSSGQEPPGRAPDRCRWGPFRAWRRTSSALPCPRPAYSGPMDRRIFGIENEYGVTCTFRGQRRLSPDEVARYLFRKVVSWGRSSNVFLRNGARLSLDVGSHPEYAAPECDDVAELVAHDKAGERVLEGLLLDAEQRLHDEGIAGDIPLQEQHRLRRQLLWLPRELPGEQGGGVQPAGRRTDPVSRDAASHRRRRQGEPDAARRVVRRESACRAHLGGRQQRHHPQPSDHQHP